MKMLNGLGVEITTLQQYIQGTIAQEAFFGVDLNVPKLADFVVSRSIGNIYFLMVDPDNKDRFQHFDFNGSKVKFGGGYQFTQGKSYNMHKMPLNQHSYVIQRSYKLGELADSDYFLKTTANGATIGSFVKALLATYGSFSNAFKHMYVDAVNKTVFQNLSDVSAEGYASEFVFDTQNDMYISNQTFLLNKFVSHVNGFDLDSYQESLKTRIIDKLAKSIEGSDIISGIEIANFEIGSNRDFIVSLKVDFTQSLIDKRALAGLTSDKVRCQVKCVLVSNYTDKFNYHVKYLSYDQASGCISEYLLAILNQA